MLWRLGFILLCLNLSACGVFNTQTSRLVTTPMISLSAYPNSAFKQVQARLIVPQSRDLVFRVLSDVKRTPQWFDRLQSMNNLAFYDVNHFLLQARLNSPWPFKNREIISCVATEFEDSITRIQIRACSERQPLSGDYIRVEQARSSWVLSELKNGRTLIEYQAWLDPGGRVPALFFNWNLRASTAKTLAALQQTLALSKREDFAY